MKALSFALVDFPGRGPASDRRPEPFQERRGSSLHVPVQGMALTPPAVSRGLIWINPLWMGSAYGGIA